VRPLRVVFLALNSPGYRSLGCAYVRAYAQHDRRLSGAAAFTTLDLDAGTDPWWVAYRVLELQPDVVAASVMCWSARDTYEALRIVKAAAPDTLVVAGGPEVSPIGEDVLAGHPEIDAVVAGEGELTFADLLAARIQSRPFERVEGIAYRSPDGEVRSTPPRQLPSDLDVLPSPYLTGILQPVDGATYIETYRGCPHRCGYCFEGKGSTRIRAFSKQRVEAEIDLIASTPGVRSFSFIDPVFNLTRERLAWLSKVLGPYAQAGARIHTVEVDIERIDDEAALLLAEAGVVSVETGPQTTGADALSACRRAFDRDRFIAGVEACKRRGIRVECDLIVGLPGDTIGDSFESMRFCIGLDPGKIQTSTLRVLPGTDFFERADELGVVFDPEPPHEVICTREASFVDLRRAEVRLTWLQRQYEARA
jgi:radical SAM superfamily enzyme YgiQ (UPF0313 family)